MVWLNWKKNMKKGHTIEMFNVFNDRLCCAKINFTPNNLCLPLHSPTNANNTQTPYRSFPCSAEQEERDQEKAALPQ